MSEKLIRRFRLRGTSPTGEAETFSIVMRATPSRLPSSKSRSAVSSRWFIRTWISGSDALAARAGDPRDRKTSTNIETVDSFIDTS
jgi:hypothetical protein